ncbi:MotE family protein [Desulfovibrio sp.]
MSVRPSRIILWVLLLGLIKLGLVGAAGFGLFDGRPAKAERPVVAALEPKAAQAQTATPPAKTQDAARGQKPAQDAALPPAGSPADWKILKQREEDLASKERSLKALEKSLDDKLVELKQVEQRIQAMLDQADVLKDEKLKHLVDVYSNMKSKQAAAVLETLDDALAVKILSGMRGRTAGEILSNVRADRAAVLTEALTRLQAPLETPAAPARPQQ